MFEQVKIILMNTTHPGNVGAVARAMKNMGFTRLHLVGPKDFPSEEALARACGAEELLNNAGIHDTLEEAIGDCHWVMGLSARERRLSLPVLSVRTAASVVVDKLEQDSRVMVAVLLGQEQSGLSNEALMQCHYQIMIPANPLYSSLNIAQALQIMTYELRVAMVEKPLQKRLSQREKSTVALATMAEMERYYRHLTETLIQIGFLDPKSPGHLMHHVRRLYAKASVTTVELNILHGILTAVQNRV